MSEFEPGRYWRVVYGPTAHVWCETSNEQQAREALVTCPSPGTLQRLYERTDREWRTEG